MGYAIPPDGDDKHDRLLFIALCVVVTMILFSIAR
jgi:hypothetical protein